MIQNKMAIQLIWGTALVAAGVGIFIALPQKMAQLSQMDYTDFYILFTRLCFYLIALLLIGGGSKKLYDTYRIWDEARPKGQPKAGSKAGPKE